MFLEADHNPTNLPASWLSTLAGSLLFILTGLMLILYEIPHEWQWQWADTLAQTFFLLNFLLPPFFYAVGWIKGFPAWSYPYIAHVLQWSFYMTMVATPGLRFFDYTFGSNDLWGWRAWIPFALATGIALLVTRSLDNLLNLIMDDSQDWTRYTFGMFGFFPMWFFINFDGMDRLYSLYFMAFLAIIMPVTALAYLRSRTTRRRALVLFAGIFSAVVAVTAGNMFYGEVDGWLRVTRPIMMGISLLLALFSPGLISWMQKKAATPGSSSQATES
jgi:hypothetical protein